MKLCFLGDISFNDIYQKMYQKGISPFSTLKFGEVDYIIGNLECLAEGIEGENLLKNPRLKTSVETLNYLNDIGVDIVELAHNHIYDNLKSGFERTINFLDRNNIKYLGASQIKGYEREPIVLSKGKVSVCLLNYVTKDTNPSLPNNASVFLNWFDKDVVVNDIKVNKMRYDYVVLLLHWGGLMEGAMQPDFAQRGLAHDLIDAGADIIVGNHSHTIQPFEIYDNKYIFYSLGNFCFSDRVNRETGDIEGSMNLAKNRYSRILEVDFNREKLNVNIRYLYRNKDNGVSEAKKPFSVLFHQYFFSFFYRYKIVSELYIILHRLYTPIEKVLFDSNITFVSILKRINKKSLKRYFGFS